LLEQPGLFCRTLKDQTRSILLLLRNPKRHHVARLRGGWRQYAAAIFLVNRLVERYSKKCAGLGFAGLFGVYNGTAKFG
jgi:hypothetical protein